MRGSAARAARVGEVITGTACPAFGAVRALDDLIELSGPASIVPRVLGTTRAQPGESFARFQELQRERQQWFEQHQRSFFELQPERQAIEDDETELPLLTPAQVVQLNKRKLAFDRRLQQLSADGVAKNEWFRVEGDKLIAEHGLRSADKARLWWQVQAVTAVLVWIPVTVAVLLGWYGERHPIGSDFYSAVAATIPALVIAGFVELAALRGAIWRAGVLLKIATFTVYATSTEALSLAALAHSANSTDGVYTLTIVGISITMFTLVAFVVSHQLEAQSAMGHTTQQPEQDE
jgi:hypothetical protein